MRDPHEELFAALGRRYEFLDILGVGGMGTVYLAIDRKHDRKVAIKTIRPDLTTEGVRHRFQREISITARLQHPHILALLDSGIIGETLYYIMPYIEGESLEQRLRREGRLPVEEVVRIARDVLKGLEHAHQQGVVHRDIKPGNIMLTPTYSLIMDFGIAKALAGSRDELVTGRGWLGTPAYMAPEQFRGASTPTSDVYALGAVMFEALGGRQWPMDTKRDTADWSGIDVSLSPILRRALAESPKARWPSAAALGAALQDWTRDAIMGSGAALGGRGIGPLLRRARTLFSRVQAAHPPPKSIAVLPLENLNRDQETEYFSDGITEDIIAQLSKIRDLKVISRTSVMRYKQADVSIRRIGRELNVATVLEGSVRLGEGRVRIVSQLIDARTDRHLWAETYDRELTDIFTIQAEVASRIAQALDAHLSTGEGARLVVPPTDDVAAYDLYLKGRREWNRRTRDGFTRSVEHLQEAVRADPKFALAYAALSDTYVTQGLYGLGPPEAVMPLARQAAERSLELDPNQAEAYAALGSVQSLYEWDWEGAEGTYRRAIELGPGYAVAHQWYANHVLMPRGRFDSARDELECARDLDPLAPSIAVSVALLDYYQLRFKRAVTAFREVIKSSPDFWLAYYFLGWSLLETGHGNEAVTALEIARHLSNGAVSAAAGLGYVFASVGREDEARNILTELEARSTSEYVSPLRIAQVYQGLGEESRALDWLERAVAGRDIGLALINVQHGFGSLEGNERFETVRRTVLD